MDLNQIISAREKMKGIVHQTPLDFSQTFTDMSHNEVYLKLENLQKTGSFKVRGSINKLTSLSKEELSKGVIAASAGNHAQGVAYSSKMLNIPCTIVMPKGAPLSKIQATKNYGAEIVLEGDAFDDALAHAMELSEKQGFTLVHTFDDDEIIAGQGTIGLEILEQLPDVEAIICPVGGGGLIAGIAVAVKEKNPNVAIYGVEASACPSMAQSLLEKKPISVPSGPTVADGIAVKKPGVRNLEIVEKYVDDLVTVDELEMIRTMFLLLERNKLLVEGSGASSLAALLYKKLNIKGKKVVALLSGGNVDVNFISRIIERGMVEAGRYARFSIIIVDKPGELQRVLTNITEADANILSVHHTRMGRNIYPGYTEIEIAVETKSHEHILDLQKTLTAKGYRVDFWSL
ncbi:MAG: threonine ammonia-lyase [Bacillus sp. (in: firmicutes)]